MKKYFFETPVTQLDRSAEHDYIFCTHARVLVYAENEEDALSRATEKFHSLWDGTGFALLDSVTLTKVCELPVDWSYGYGDDRTAGTTDEDAIRKLNGETVIR